MRITPTRNTPQRNTPAASAAVPHLFVGEMSAKERMRVRDILVATGVFREQEIDVAIELFDEVFGTPIAIDGTSTVYSTKPPPSEDYFFIGAFTGNDELVGFACYGPTPGTDRTFDLYWIAVHPSEQGSGSGTVLLNEVERRLRGLNARLIVVETSSRADYKNTRGFYFRRGYAEAARAKDFYAPADDRITFTKRLQSRDPMEWVAQGVEQQ
ncbi:MAG: GNAT family N-acetyltransferase [Gemmatimonadaceae bacterium]